MTKTELIARLEELGSLLGRQPDTSGTVTELELRLREAEDEYAELNSDSIVTATDPTFADTAKKEVVSQSLSADYVRMTPLCTVHIRGRDPVSKKAVEIAVAGRQVEVPAEDAEAWLKSGKMKLV
jgi:hypothetical protein